MTEDDNLGSVRVQFVQVLKGRTKYGGYHLLFRITEPGHSLDGQPVACFVNAPVADKDRAGDVHGPGRIGWSPGSKYAKAWILANRGLPRRWDRLPPKVFKGKTFEAELVCSGKELHKLYEESESPREYKVDRLIRLISDEEAEARHPTAEVGQEVDRIWTESGQEMDKIWPQVPCNSLASKDKLHVLPRKSDNNNRHRSTCIASPIGMPSLPRSMPSSDIATGIDTSKMSTSLFTFHETHDRLGVYGIIIDPNEGKQRTLLVCPQCSHQRKKDTARCLSVDTVYGTWTCFHCSWSGNVSVGETKPPWGDGPSIPRPGLPKAEEIQEVNLPVLEKGTERQALLAFMAQRGIAEAVVDRNGVTLRIQNGRGWVNFPYRRHGMYMHTKSRRYDKKEFLQYVDGVYRGHIEPILYNEDVLRTGPDWVVIVEGELDVLAVQTAGIEQVVSVPTGAGTKNCDWLPAVITEFQGLQSVVLAVDRDGPGQQLALRLKQVLDRVKPDLCRFVNWDLACDCQGTVCKDANDVLRRHGGLKLAYCLTEASRSVDGPALAACDGPTALEANGICPGSHAEVVAVA